METIGTVLLVGAFLLVTLGGIEILILGIFFLLPTRIAWVREIYIDVLDIELHWIFRYIGAAFCLWAGYLFLHPIAWLLG